MIDVDLRNDNLARKLAEDDIQHALIVPQTNALQGSDMRRCSINELLRVDRMRRPCISKPVAYGRVALDARQLRYFIALAEELSFAL